MEVKKGDDWAYYFGDRMKISRSKNNWERRILMASGGIMR